MDGANVMEIGIADLADCQALADLLGVLFTQEDEFVPDVSAQTRGLSLILADPGVGHILAARVGGRVVGMVSVLYTVSTALGAKVALLEDMVVAPQERGRGIGSALLDHAIAFARSQGCRRMTLLTDGGNVRAQTFYRRHGFAGSEMTPMRSLL
jgi:GNAT superfamily N-acetyltransferase